MWTSFKGKRAQKVILCPNRVQTRVPAAQIHYKVVEPKLVKRIEDAISWVLNPLSHSQTVERYRREIEDAIYAVEDLEYQIKKAQQFRDKPSPHQNLIQMLQIINLIAIAKSASTLADITERA